MRGASGESRGETARRTPRRKSASRPPVAPVVGHREDTLHRIGRFVVLTSALACASGGSSTRLSDSWREPNTTQLGFNRTLVVYMSPDQGARQAVEDRLASRVPNGVPAYRAL